MVGVSRYRYRVSELISSISAVPCRALNQESEECCGPANDTAQHNERALFSLRRYAFLLPFEPSPFFPPPLAWAAATPAAAAAFTNGAILLFFTSPRHYCEVQGTDPSVSAPKNAHEKKQANEPTRVSRLLPFHLLVPSLRAPPSTHNAHTTQYDTRRIHRVGYVSATHGTHQEKQRIER